jgi:4-aminobutyrate aminotransferase-like enzyme/Ser/Thr protein kinase RdoA (MazF antagonist)
MLLLHYRRPALTAIEASAILEKFWSLPATLEPLPGERDLNFRINTAERKSFVLKLTAAEYAEAVELELAALLHVAARNPELPVPRVVPTHEGELFATWEDGEARTLARLLTWLPGTPLANWKPHSPELQHCVGESLGRLALALRDFCHPGAARALKWELGSADWALEHLSRISDPEKRSRLEEILVRHRTAVLPALASLRRAVLHNDGNDHNILVAASESGSPRVSGILDFGDVCETTVAADVAIAMAYSMLGKPDPLSAAAQLLAGYNSVWPLEEQEIDQLFDLVRTRLALSVVNAALQAELQADNTYLQISAEPAWNTLERLGEFSPRLALYRFRHACGWEPCPTGALVAHWLAQNRGSYAPLLGKHPPAQDVHILDLSVESGDLGTIDVWSDQSRFSVHVEEALRRAGVRLALGRYDEVRPLYTSQLFAVEGNEGREWRTVHTAIDLCAAPGTPIFAPLAGIVHSQRDNSGEGNYGPTIVLEHRVDGGQIVFWTLYGHLSRESLQRLETGAPIGAGELIGWIGDSSVNGGWWPHVHVQVIADLLGYHGDFPGVARPAERAVWLSLSPDPAPLLALPPESRAPSPPSVAQLLGRRSRVIGRSLSVSYRNPLHIVRGAMQYLYDAEGQRYLDAVNNVAHVGHEHPEVVRAIQRQAALLNTNSRYLHRLMVEYAEELLATLPEPLRVCYFVCSGSEANELAMRLARAYTGERDTIVVEAAYHGNTTTLIDISPYKFDGPGGAGAPPWVHEVPLPDDYRGPFRRDDPQAGLKYAQAVREAVARIRTMGRRPAAFICESILSCAGQIVLPPGYLREAYRHVRAAGGVCIADEVQVGLGRSGTHFWGFETQGVVPDIVTLGKPLGNGHPLGAVITTPEISAAFANGMEYFNTFGGNPVSCAAGLAVLRVVQRDRLQQRAAALGKLLLGSLRELADTHPLIGDVRGMGLFLGVELVRDREQRIPASAQASYVANRMRQRGVLVSTDGPDNNVLKIKPPLCWNEHDVHVLVAALDQVLAETPAQPA